MRKVIGIDLGATNIRIGVINENLEILDVIREETNRSGVNGLVLQILKLIGRIKGDHLISNIAIGVPGRVKWDGFIFELPNLDLKDIPLKEEVEKAFNIPTRIANDAEVAGLAEAMAGSGKEYRKTYYLTISSGIGGALYDNCQAKYGIPEIGHTLFDVGGKLYEVEKIASGYGILTLANVHGVELAHGFELFHGYRDGNGKIKEIYLKWLDIITELLGFVDNLLEPEVFVLSGGVMKSGEIFLPDLLTRNPGLNIVRAHFDQDAGLIGAGCLALLR